MKRRPPRRDVKLDLAAFASGVGEVAALLEFIEERRADFERGDKRALFHALSAWATYDERTPEWIRAALDAIDYGLLNGDITNAEQIAGSIWPKKTTVARKRRDSSVWMWANLLWEKGDNLDAAIRYVGEAVGLKEDAAVKAYKRHSKTVIDYRFTLHDGKERTKSRVSKVPKQDPS